MRVLLVLLFLLPSVCLAEQDKIHDLPPLPMKVYLHSGSPLAAETAIKTWNNAVGFQMVVFAEKEQADVTLSLAPLEFPTLGLAYSFPDGTCNILITYSRWDDARVYIHEIGHCLGLGHSSLRESIMYKAIMNETLQGILQETTNALP